MNGWRKAQLWLVSTILGASSTIVAPAAAEEAPKHQSIEQFEAFLRQSLDLPVVNDERVARFGERTNAFWNEQKYAYWDNPEPYRTALSLYYRAQLVYERHGPLSVERFRANIEQFKRFDARNTVSARAVLFVGSSSIVFWETANAFPGYRVINRGFGGATLPEVNYYLGEIVVRYKPTIIVVYCDSDIEMKRSPDEALGYFKEFYARVTHDLPNTKILFLSMKPTLVDDFLGPNVRSDKEIANRKLAEFAQGQKNLTFVDVATPMLRPDGRVKPEIFLGDGQHLNSRGYEIWNPIVQRYLAEVHR